MSWAELGAEGFALDRLAGGRDRAGPRHGERLPRRVRGPGHPLFRVRLPALARPCRDAPRLLPKEKPFFGYRAHFGKGVLARAARRRGF